MAISGLSATVTSATTRVEEVARAGEASANSLNAALLKNSRAARDALSDARREIDDAGEARAAKLGSAIASVGGRIESAESRLRSDLEDARTRTENALAASAARADREAASLADKLRDASAAARADMAEATAAMRATIEEAKTALGASIKTALSPVLKAQQETETTIEELQASTSKLGDRVESNERSTASAHERIKALEGNIDAFSERLGKDIEAWQDTINSGEGRVTGARPAVRAKITNPPGLPLYRTPPPPLP